MGIRNKTLIRLLLLFSLFFSINSITISSGPDPDNPNDPETPVGYWKLNVKQTFTEKDEWKGYEGDLNIFSRWLDYMNVQHQINCNMRWTTLPDQLRPGIDTKFTAEFINKEYSTTSSLQTGLRLIVVNIKPFTVFDLKKNLDNHYSEVRNSVIVVPKYNDDKEFRVIIECYSGQSKYTIIYKYNWVTE